MGFILYSGDMIYPLIFITVVTAVFTLINLRWRMLASGTSRLLFCALPLTWIALIPWAAAHVDTGLNSGNPASAGWPVTAALIVFPLLAVILFVRARGARWFTGLFAILNAPCWLLSCAVTAMAVTGDWI